MLYNYSYKRTMVTNYKEGYRMTKITTAHCELINLLLGIIYEDFEFTERFFYNFDDLNNVEPIKIKMENIGQKTAGLVGTTKLRRERIKSIIQSGDIDKILHYCTERKQSEQYKIKDTASDTVKRIGEYIKSYRRGYNSKIVNLMVQDGYFEIIKTKMMEILK